MKCNLFRDKELELLTMKEGEDAGTIKSRT